MGKHHAPEVIEPVHNVNAQIAEVFTPDLSGDQWRQVGRNIAALAQVAVNQRGRLDTLANSYAERCHHIVELRREIKRLEWELETLRNGQPRMHPFGPCECGCGSPIPASTRKDSE